jgi:hypothetical protein
MATSIVQFNNLAFVALAPNQVAHACSIVQIDLVSFQATGLLTQSDCDGNLVSVSRGTTGNVVYFGSDSSPARVYAIQVSDALRCPDDCNGHGICTQVGSLIAQGTNHDRKNWLAFF